MARVLFILFGVVLIVASVAIVVHALRTRLLRVGNFLIAASVWLVPVAIMFLASHFAVGGGGMNNVPELAILGAGTLVFTLSMVGLIPLAMESGRHE